MNDAPAVVASMWDPTGGRRRSWTVLVLGVFVVATVAGGTVDVISRSRNGFDPSYYRLTQRSFGPKAFLGRPGRSDIAPLAGQQACEAVSSALLGLSSLPGDTKQSRVSDRSYVMGRTRIEEDLALNNPSVPIVAAELPTLLASCHPFKQVTFPGPRVVFGRTTQQAATQFHWPGAVAYQTSTRTPQTATGSTFSLLLPAGNTGVILSLSEDRSISEADLQRIVLPLVQDARSGLVRAPRYTPPPPVASPLRVLFAPPPSPWVELHGQPREGPLLPAAGNPNYQRSWTDGDLELSVIIVKYRTAAQAASDPAKLRRHPIGGDTSIPIPGAPGVVATTYGAASAAQDTAAFAIGTYLVNINVVTDGPSPQNLFVTEVLRQYDKLKSVP